jgi:transcriptional regulator with XRE-family HTH domain
LEHNFFAILNCSKNSGFKFGTFCREQNQMSSLKAIRAQIGLTQKQFAEFLHISRSQMAKLELNMRTVPYDILLLTARIEIALLKFKNITGIPFINNARSKPVNGNKTDQSYLQHYAFLFVITELRKEYTDEFNDERLHRYIHMKEFELNLWIKAHDE